MSSLTFRAFAEDRPGPRFAELFEELWPDYERWFASEGESARPTYLSCSTELRKRLPQFEPVWRELCEAVDAGDRQSRFLSLYRPPPYLTGCSQAVWVDDEPVLVRNYDYAAELFEALVLRTEWKRPVVAVSDCLLGVLDGMNDAGLCVSLSFGGRRVVGDGFGAPLLLRAMLESCETTAETKALLKGVRPHMAYTFLIVDREGDFTTAFVRPDRPPAFRRVPVSTNHQERIEWRRHATATGTLEREQYLLSRLSDADETVSGFVGSFLKAPVFSEEYGRGFGTLYTSVYYPTRGKFELRWPGQVWRFDLDDFTEGTRVIEYE